MIVDFPGDERKFLHGPISYERMKERELKFKNDFKRLIRKFMVKNGMNPIQDKVPFKDWLTFIDEKNLPSFEDLLKE